MIKDKISKSQNVILYTVSFLVVFLSVLYIKFPNDRLNTWITTQIVVNTGLSYVDIKSAKLKPLFTVELTGLTLKKNPDQTLQLNRAVLKPSLLSLLTSNISVPFNITLDDGRVFGDLVYSRENNSIKSLNFDVEHLDLDKISQVYSPSISDKAKISGYLFGNFNLNEKNQGDFRFNIDKLDLSNIKIGTMKLPDFPDLQSTLTGKVKGQSTQIDELSFNNDDIALMINGTMPPLRRLPRGRIDLYYKLQVKSNKYAYIKSFLAKDEQGNHAGKIGGTLGNPEFVGKSDNPAMERRNMRQRIDKTNLFKPREKLSL